MNHTSFNTARLRAAINRAPAIMKKTKKEAVQMAAKGFVKDIVAITPPASKGVTGAAARKAGENAIIADLSKLAIPVQGVSKKRGQGTLATADQLLAAHKSSRVAGGRVNPRNREKLLVELSVFNAVARQLFLLVGTLAAGWNSSANKLGVKVPAWISRHGDKYGAVKITVTAFSFRMELSNVVPFVGDVRAYHGRVQKAIDYQANKLDRQLDYLQKKVLKKAGY